MNIKFVSMIKGKHNFTNGMQLMQKSYINIYLFFY